MERCTLESRAFTHRLITNFKLNGQKNIPVYFNIFLYFIYFIYFLDISSIFVPLWAMQLLSTKFLSTTSYRKDMY